MSTISKLHISAIIPIAFILYTLFIFCFSLTYIISFISLFDVRFKNTCLTFIFIVVYIVDNELRFIYIYIFAFYIYSLILFVFSSLSIVFFNLFNIIIILICLFFVENALSRHIIFSIKAHYQFNTIIEIPNVSFFSIYRVF
jgi:hypothetical protein